MEKIKLYWKIYNDKGFEYSRKDMYEDLDILRDELWTTNRKTKNYLLKYDEDDSRKQIANQIESSINSLIRKLAGISDSLEKSHSMEKITELLEDFRINMVDLRHFIIQTRTIYGWSSFTHSMAYTNLKKSLFTIYNILAKIYLGNSKIANFKDFQKAIIRISYCNKILPNFDKIFKICTIYDKDTGEDSNISMGDLKVEYTREWKTFKEVGVIRVRELANLFGITEGAVRNWKPCGHKIKFYKNEKFVEFDCGDVERFVMNDSVGKNYRYKIFDKILNEPVID